MFNITGKEIKISFIAACVTCLLYSSGFLVIFTPFPIYFVFTMYGKKIANITVFMTFAASLAVYLVLMPAFYESLGSWSLKELVYLIPGAAMTDIFSLKSAQIVGLFYLCYFILFGYFFGEGLSRKWSLNKWFSVSVGGTFLLMITIFIVLNIMGMNISGGLRAYMHSVLNELIAAQESAGVSGERIFAVKRNAQAIIDFSLGIMPAVAFLLGLVVAAANFLLAKWVIKIPPRFAHFGKIKHYTVPPYFIWASIALGFIFFVERYALHSNVLKYIVLNGLIALSGIYFIQGLMIVSFYVKKLRSRLFKFLVYFTMIMFIQIAAPILVIIGFADLWIDFRRLMGKEISNKGVSHGSNST